MHQNFVGWALIRPNLFVINNQYVVLLGEGNSKNDNGLEKAFK